MAPLAAAAPGFGQDDVDLTVGFDDLFTVVIVFTGVCLAVLVAFAVGALWVTSLDADEPVSQGPPKESTGGPRGTAAPRLPRHHPGVPPTANSVRRVASSAPARSSARGHYTVPLPRSVARRIAAPAPATPRRYETVPLPRSVIEALKAYTKH
jgi:hypothetical protein